MTDRVQEDAPVLVRTGLQVGPRRAQGQHFLLGPLDVDDRDVDVELLSSLGRGPVRGLLALGAPEAQHHVLSIAQVDPLPVRVGHFAAHQVLVEVGEGSGVPAAHSSQPRGPPGASSKGGAGVCSSR